MAQEWQLFEPEPGLQQAQEYLVTVNAAKLQQFFRILPYLYKISCRSPTLLKMFLSVLFLNF